MTLYESVESLVARIEEPNRSACARIVAEHRALFATVQGSTHNHQAWRGGYLDHVSEVMNIAKVPGAVLRRPEASTEIDPAKPRAVDLRHRLECLVQRIARGVSDQ